MWLREGHERLMLEFATLQIFTNIYKYSVKVVLYGSEITFFFYIGDIIVLLKPLQWSGERQNWNKTEHRNIIYENC